MGAWSKAEVPGTRKLEKISVQEVASGRGRGLAQDETLLFWWEGGVA